MNIRHKLGGLAGTATLMIVLAASAAPTQGATAKAKAKPDCPEKALCVWADENYQGQRVVVKDRSVSNKIFDKMNDEASSAFYNRKKGVAALWTDTDAEGEANCLTEGNRWRLKSFTGGFDNSTSSSEVTRNIPAGCLL